MDKSPRALSTTETRRAYIYKKAECSFYSACLDQAIHSDWDQFGCDQCRAFQEIDALQKMQDLEGLQVMQFAADHALEYGNAGRKRGVKPGAEARGGEKRRRHLRVVTESEDCAVGEEDAAISAVA